MGHTIWIEAKGPGAKKTHQDMNVLVRLEKHLNALAEKLGVTKMSEFYDYRELIAAYDESDEADVPKPAWYDSGKGLQTFTALRKTLEKDFKALKWKAGKSTQHYPSTLMENVQFCETVLEKAVASGKPFRLLIVP